jgi:hypothetical protein
LSNMAPETGVFYQAQVLTSAKEVMRETSRDRYDTAASYIPAPESGLMLTQGTGTLP